jgi:subtilisin family serine protease
MSMCRCAPPALGGLLVLVLVLGPGTPPQPAPAETVNCPEIPCESIVTPPDVDRFLLRQRTEHLARLGVEDWHGAGCRGQGVKVAVLDTGFRGYRGKLGTVLPARVNARSFREDRNLEAKDSQHGILCAEIIHAVAPEAELLFANWDADQPAGFLDAVRWARRQGARIISCSVIMPGWSDGEGGGPVHAALEPTIGSGREAGDLLFFASAGNTARRHWTGPFHDNGSGWHQWAPDRLDNLLTPWSLERVSVALCWSARPSYRVTVVDADTGKEVARSTAAPGDSGCVVVRFDPEEYHQYRVRIQCLQGAPGKFHLLAMAADLERTTARGSILFPADGTRVLAVGAVDAAGQRCSYSSCGPNSRQPKPDFVGLVPFPSLWRPQPFGGTSAAAPQAAGLAALWASRHPTWTAQQISEALRQSAQDLGPPGHDWETGHGRLLLPVQEKADKGKVASGK